jgi:hypothetical protein
MKFFSQPYPRSLVCFVCAQNYRFRIFPQKTNSRRIVASQIAVWSRVIIIYCGGFRFLDDFVLVRLNRPHPSQCFKYSRRDIDDNYEKKSTSYVIYVTFKNRASYI